ncbi:hypothetical protein QDR37_11355 [Amnibacterium sp. CER49]|uniref:hypothetical protein n=1 Tax=Amnibacterium sp. CER49 TaxID=3039161 RepID=UPI0024471F84|nr:hypothetical protein [Amnibacterium sp. CER49]MDH2444542.1 hypothetical protein [Amnibacterium sp. CER49]
MTTSPLLPATAALLRARRLEPRTVFLLGAGIAAVSLVVALAGLVLDARTIQGAPAWLKPAKFGISITIYMATLQWIASLVRGHRRLLLAIGTTLGVGLTAELVLIDLQVLRGTTSHFNVSSPFDAVVWESMGGFVSLVFLATAALALLAIRIRGTDAGIASGLRWGLLLALLGMAEAGLMIANTTWNPGGGHTIGAPDGGPGLPLTDWSTLHGDLRIGHFAGLHALQALPILAWLLAAFTPLDLRTRVRLVRVAAAGYASVIGLLAWQALRGQPLLRPDLLTVSAATALLAAVAAAVLLVLRTRPQTLEAPRPAAVHADAAA